MFFFIFYVNKIESSESVRLKMLNIKFGYILLIFLYFSATNHLYLFEHFQYIITISFKNMG